MKKQALGKGLKAFISDDYGIFQEDRYTEIGIDLLIPNPSQPRKYFDSTQLEELSKSIKESGILQPILVVPEKDRFKIIVGERRWRAAQKAGLTKIPVIIRNMEKAKQIEATLIENIQREDLNPLEIAEAYQNMIKTLQYSQSEVAEKVGKDRTSIANYIRLLKLPNEIKEYLKNNSISMGHARALLSLEDSDLQKNIAHKIIQAQLSVRKVEKLISNQHKIKRNKEDQEQPPPDPNLAALEEKLMKILGSKTRISGNSDKGVINIHYFSLEDLNRIFDIIKGV